MLVALMVASRRGRNRAKETEDVAAAALPQIGKVAERTYEQRFGRAPTDMPVVSRTSSGTWYPPTKSRLKHG
jgi:hypothetical protein